MAMFRANIGINCQLGAGYLSDLSPGSRGTT